MRFIAFITHISNTRQILESIGVETESPRITLARKSPLWNDAVLPAPEFIVDQRISW